MKTAIKNAIQWATFAILCIGGIGILIWALAASNL